MDDKALKKLLDKLPDSYVDTIESMSKDELRDEVMKCQTVIIATEKDKEEDTKLNGAKELAKDLGSAYSRAIGTQKAKTKYVFYLMELRGYL